MKDQNFEDNLHTAKVAGVLAFLGAFTYYSWVGIYNAGVLFLDLVLK